MNEYACDTPAKIAIIGAGPIGLEAALYARFLGYDVALYERDEVAASVVALAAGNGASEPLGAFVDLHSPLGLAAIESQDDAYSPPAADAQITAAQWLERYLKPLAATDLLDGCLRVGAEVVRIGSIAGEEPEFDDADELDEDEEAAPDRFEIHLRNAEDGESIDCAAVVIDTTGAGLIEVPRRRRPSRAGMAFDVTVPHPHYHLLGFDPDHCGPITFLQGLTQVRILFSLIGDRDALDLYSGARGLLKRR